jgi:hypothetical protein
MFEPIYEYKCKIVGHIVYGLKHVLKYKIQKKFVLNSSEEGMLDVAIVRCVTSSVRCVTSSLDGTWCCSTTETVRMATGVVETYT